MRERRKSSDWRSKRRHDCVLLASTQSRIPAQDYHPDSSSAAWGDWRRDSVNHIFCATAAGGFSTKNSRVAFFNSAYIGGVLAAFTIIAGVNFTLHHQLLSGNFRTFVKDSEARFFLERSARPGQVDHVILHADRLAGDRHGPGAARPRVLEKMTASEEARMRRCASSSVIATYTKVRLIPRNSRALPAGFLRGRPTSRLCRGSSKNGKWIERGGAMCYEVRQGL
jgi:hypothetical protein